MAPNLISSNLTLGKTNPDFRNVKTNRFLVLWVGLMSALIAYAVPLQAQDDWNQFRGPNRDGISSEIGLLESWKKPPAQLWKAEGLGRGFSSLAIHKGVSFTTGDRKDGSYVIANNLENNGEEVWATKIGPSYNLRSGYEGARSTPTIDNGKMYVSSFRGAIHCLECSTGKLIWSFVFAKELNVNSHPEWGFAESVMIDGDNVICTPGARDSMVVAIDKSNGELRWKLNLASAFESKGVKPEEVFAEMEFPQGGGDEDEPSKESMIEELLEMSDDLEQVELEKLDVDDLRKKLDEFSKQRIIEYLLEMTDKKKEALQVLDIEALYDLADEIEYDSEQMKAVSVR